jgi:hypothetical protein
MPIVGNNRDFEVLALARKAGARGESLARIERRLREVEDANRTVVTPPAGINNLLIGSDFDHSIFTFQIPHGEWRPTCSIGSWGETLTI